MRRRLVLVSCLLSVLEIVSPALETYRFGKEQTYLWNQEEGPHRSHSTKYCKENIGAITNLFEHRRHSDTASRTSQLDAASRTRQ